MPVVVGVVAAFAVGAAGVTAAAAATTLIGTIAAYATVAGAVLSGVGAITGNKSLMKIGAVLSIGGGIGTLASGAIGGAAAGAAGATAGSEAASAAGGLTAAQEAYGALEAANAAAGGGGNLVGAAGGAAGAGAAQTGALPAAETSITSGGLAAPGAGELSQGVFNPSSLTGAYSTAPVTEAAGGLGQLGGQTTTGLTAAQDAYGSLEAANAATGGGGNLATGMQTTATTPTGTMGKVADAAKGFNSNDLSSWWQRAAKAGGAVGDFIQKNPQLVKIGTEMVGSMFGPEAEALDYQKSLINRQRKNLNTPIHLVARPLPTGA